MLKIQTKGPRDDCFGKRWSASAPECVGGALPTYRDERGGHVLPACDVREACSVRTLAERQAEELAGASVRFVERPAHSAAYAHEPLRVEPPRYAPAHTHMPIQGNYQMPPYLTVREPLGQPRMKRLFSELLRSLLKSLGHTLSNFSDTEPFTDRNHGGEP